LWLPRIRAPATPEEVNELKIRIARVETIKATQIHRTEEEAA
jgi:hypothetical protein